MASPSMVKGATTPDWTDPVSLVTEIGVFITNNAAKISRCGRVNAFGMIASKVWLTSLQLRHGVDVLAVQKWEIVC